MGRISARVPYIFFIVLLLRVERTARREGAEIRSEKGVKVYLGIRVVRFWTFVYNGGGALLKSCFLTH